MHQRRQFKDASLYTFRGLSNHFACPPSPLRTPHGVRSALLLLVPVPIGETPGPRTSAGRPRTVRKEDKKFGSSAENVCKTRKIGGYDLKIVPIQDMNRGKPACTPLGYLNRTNKFQTGLSRFSSFARLRCVPQGHTTVPVPGSRPGRQTKSALTPGSDSGPVSCPRHCIHREAVALTAQFAGLNACARATPPRGCAGCADGKRTADRAAARPGDAGRRGGYSALRGGSVQSIGACPCRARYSLAAEKWPQPMKPRCADNGDGCGALSTRWRRASMTLPLAWA